MNKRQPKQNAQNGEHESRTVSGGISPQSRPKKGSSPSSPSSTPQPVEGSAGPEKCMTAGGRKFLNNVEDLDRDLKDLVDKMLVEGSTFEDVVEAVNDRGKDGTTLNAVQNYFQGHREIQTKRVHRLIENGEALLASIGKDPKSAEARLARATFLTGYLKVRRDSSQITPKDAERVRMESENLSLKRRILVMQKQKAQQELKYSHARTHMVLLTQEKLKEEIQKLQQEAKGHRAGEPMGPEMLQKIQQLYGLACQPLFDEESAHASAKG